MPIKYGDGIKKPNQQMKLTGIQKDELSRCANDVVYFAENYYKILNPVMGLMNVYLYDYQREMLEGIHNNDFSMTIAFRQSGKTLCNGIYILWYSIFHPDKKVAICGNKLTTSKSILADIKLAYEHLPDWMKPGVTEYCSGSVMFENGTTIFTRATTADSLRGCTVSLLYIDEAAYCEEKRIADFWASNLPILQLGGRLSIATSANKNSGLIHSVWDKSNNIYKQLFKWTSHPNYNSDWKAAMVNDIGTDTFNKEYNCEFSD